MADSKFLVQQRVPCVGRMVSMFGENAPVMDCLHELVVRARDALSLVIVSAVFAYIVPRVNAPERASLLIVVGVYAAVWLITPHNKFGGAGTRSTSFSRFRSCADFDDP